MQNNFKAVPCCVMFYKNRMIILGVKNFKFEGNIHNLFLIFCPNLQFLMKVGLTCRPVV